MEQPRMVAEYQCLLNSVCFECDSWKTGGERALRPPAVPRLASIAKYKNQLKGAT